MNSNFCVIIYHQSGYLCNGYGVLRGIQLQSIRHSFLVHKVADVYPPIQMIVFTYYRCIV